jgi:hypothetical protein
VGLPQQLLDALNLVQADFEALSAAKAKLTADLAALVKLEQEIYSGGVVGVVIHASPPTTK